MHADVCVCVCDCVCVCVCVEGVGRCMGAMFRLTCLEFDFTLQVIHTLSVLSHTREAISLGLE